MRPVEGFVPQEDVAQVIPDEEPADPAPEEAEEEGDPEGAPGGDGSPPAEEEEVEADGDARIDPGTEEEEVPVDDEVEEILGVTVEEGALLQSGEAHQPSRHRGRIGGDDRRGKEAPRLGAFFLRRCFRD